MREGRGRGAARGAGGGSVGAGYVPWVDRWVTVPDTSGNYLLFATRPR